jgi:hypothetical protein
MNGYAGCAVVTISTLLHRRTTIDATDPVRLARFGCGLLGVDVETTIGDGQFVVLSAAKDGLTVGFQRIPEGKAGKNRLHLDLIVGDLDEATAEVEMLGGRWL